MFISRNGWWFFSCNIKKRSGKWSIEDSKKISLSLNLSMLVLPRTLAIKPKLINLEWSNTGLYGSSPTDTSYIWVYSRTGYHLTGGCFSETDRFGGDVMIWDGISHGGRTPLKIVVGNLNADGTEKTFCNQLFFHSFIVTDSSTHTNRNYLHYFQTIHT